MCASFFANAWVIQLIYVFARGGLGIYSPVPASSAQQAHMQIPPLRYGMTNGNRVRGDKRIGTTEPRVRCTLTRPSPPLGLHLHQPFAPALLHGVEWLQAHATVGLCDDFL